MTTHYLAGGPLTACQIDTRTPGELRSTEHKLVVTCEECKDTDEFKRAIQRLPQIIEGIYSRG